ncbi:MAG: toxin-antitoxin system toxin component [Gammaproteobacteria bacterium]|jgi:hypothetical protein|nr:toxin-antitoxin system toxin component [Gammaproteobacteria bacterium]
MVPYAVSIIVSKADKLLRKMQNNPRDWKIEDIKILADRYGLAFRQPGTSHVTFRASTGEKLTIPAHKPIKPIYIKQFLVLINSLGDNDE